MDEKDRRIEELEYLLNQKEKEMQSLKAEIARLDRETSNSIRQIEMLKQYLEQILKGLDNRNN